MGSAMIAWFLEVKEAKELINGRDETRAWVAGAYDAMVQLVSVLKDISPQEADEWLAEEIQEQLASRD